MLRRRKLWLRALLAIVAVVLFTAAIDLWVSASTRRQIYENVADVPHKKIGLLLGTSKYAAKGWINLYYRYRIEAAAALYKAGKVDYILVSGDNRHATYNEPETMQADLIAAGIPSDRIVLDYAGFRTLDSILRCKKVFDEDNITIISQQFHNQRALFLANREGVQAIAYNAHDVPARWSIKVMMREKLARVKMMLDLMTGKGPHFYGPRVRIGA